MVTPTNMELAITIAVYRTVVCLDGQETLRSSSRDSRKKLIIFPGILLNAAFFFVIFLVLKKAPSGFFNEYMSGS